MSQSASELTGWIQELIKRSAADQLQNVQRMNELVQRLSARDLNPQEFQEELVRFSREESTRYINDITRLGLSFYNALLELNKSYSNDFFDKVAGHPFNGHGRGQVQSVLLEISGQVGQDIVRRFVVENKQAHPVEVTFAISDFVDSSTAHNRFRPPIQIEPPRYTLNPGEEKPFAIRLSLLAQLFVPGQRYRGTIMVQGDQNLLIELQVQIERGGYAASTAAAEEQIIPVKTVPPPTKVSDLTRIKGIGPVIAGRLSAAGILSYQGLADLEDERLEEILGAAGRSRAQLHEWRKQAHKLAQIGEPT